MEGFEEDDDMPKLSGSTLAALQEFYAEKHTQEKRFEKLKEAAEGNERLSMDTFGENWNASQFWYSDETATILAKELLEGATDDTSIAVVSAPSVFIQIKNLLISGTYPISPRLCLLEFDERFSVLKEFSRYDYQKPFELPSHLRGQFDRLICDPPFLSTECQTKAAMTVRWLSKPVSVGGSSDSNPKPRIIVCTGERMEELILRVYPDVRTTTFEPQHAQGRLSNEFRCYANYEGDVWEWKLPTITDVATNRQAS